MAKETPLQSQAPQSGPPVTAKRTPAAPPPETLHSSRPFRRQTLRLKSGERWAIEGKTGSGKSVLAGFLDMAWLRAGWPVVIVDPKHRYVDESEGQVYAEAPDEATLQQPWRIKDGKFREDSPVQIYLPTNPAKTDEVLDALFFSLLERGGVVVHIEDSTGLADAHSATDGLNALWTEGRAARVPLLFLVQRPYNVPGYLWSQSENIAVFRNPDPRDRKRMAEVTGTPEVEAPIPNFSWWYFHESMDKAVLMQPLPRRYAAMLGQGEARQGKETGKETAERNGTESNGTSRQRVLGETGTRSR